MVVTLRGASLEMQNDFNIHRLDLEGKEVTLIGTAHVSRHSAEQVEAFIQSSEPDVVCVELCEARYQSLTQKNRWQNTDLFRVVREKKAFLLLLNLFMAHFQKKIGQKLGVKPGEEMLRAISAAEAVGARICLADRDIRVTLARAWRLMGLWPKIKLLAQVVLSVGKTDQITEDDIEELKKKDVLEALLVEIEVFFPDLRRILIDERDLYLTEKIRTAGGRRVVAVVGAGHVPGILHHWNTAVDLQSLNEMPMAHRCVSVMKWVVPAAILGLIVVGFFLAGPVAGKHMLKWWILANATLAGLGAAAALGHPLTVASAVVASPLTSLNPMIAAGWVSGLVEALVGKPKVKDFEHLLDDIVSIRGFWKNKITRILLVVVFTNLGSSLGTFVAIPLMVRAFA
jgi:pheromone shutdown-related protein TraB